MEHYYIYCLHNEDLPEYYVGHTKDLKMRWKAHKDDSKKYSHFKVYKYINNNGGIKNFKMEVLDESYCDLQEAKKLERYYMELLGATLNKQTPGITKTESHYLWVNKNREKTREIDAKSKQKNKEKIKERYSQKFTCVCGSSTSIYHKQRHFKSEKHIDFIKFNIGY